MKVLLKSGAKLFPAQKLFCRICRGNSLTLQRHNSLCGLFLGSSITFLYDGGWAQGMSNAWSTYFHFWYNSTFRNNINLYEIRKSHWMATFLIFAKRFSNNKFHSHWSFMKYTNHREWKHEIFTLYYKFSTFFMGSLSLFKLFFYLKSEIHEFLT